MGEMIYSKIIKRWGKETISLKIRGEKNDLYKSMTINWEDCDNIGEVLEEMIKDGDGTSNDEHSLINELIKEQKKEEEATERAYS